MTTETETTKTESTDVPRYKLTAAVGAHADKARDAIDAARSAIVAADALAGLTVGVTEAGEDKLLSAYDHKRLVKAAALLDQARSEMVGV